LRERATSIITKLSETETQLLRLAAQNLNENDQIDSRF